NRLAAAEAEVIVLAVKPQVLPSVHGELQDILQRQRPLLISIAAGVRLDQLERWFGASLPIVRCMPNTPALIGAGATGLCANARVSPAQKAQAQHILDAAGLTRWIDDEALMDTVTAISGSAPAYFFALVEALEEAAVAQGLPRDTARALAAQTCFGAGRMLTESGDDPAVLRQRVTSPHGTTQAALESFGADGLPRIVIRERSTGEEHMIAFEEEAYSLGLSGALEYDTETIRFSYSSMTTPSQVFDYDMRTRERTLLKTQEVPSGHDASQYVTRRLMAPSYDGELVPISLLHHKDTPLDGSAPCLLYGYGAYGITIPASFNTNCLSLVNRGFVYAIAHVRGGKDKGFSWYEDGKKAKKHNTFDDFVHAALHLVAEGYTDHDRIVAQGGSAGGLLIGAVANLAPQAFGGFIAEVPFVDVLATMLDDTLPLTPPEWPEWGNPQESRADYQTIAAYSPYDNVDAKEYPPILAVAGLTDPRVTYWEPAKWVARLRAKKTGRNPVLLKINMDAGHGGASGRFSRLEEIAFVYAFALKVADRLAS
ncbi:MAG: pyrroline-5-carboxylate reductase, partial [Rhizobiales bacterium]|nr:pyrroline-5-carboxylate reductase [Hyphomicrobiales bacterium]